MRFDSHITVMRLYVFMCVYTNSCFVIQHVETDVRKDVKSHCWYVRIGTRKWGIYSTDGTPYSDDS